MEKRGRLRERLLDLLFFTVGSLLYGLSVNLFTAPNQIAPGGVTAWPPLLNHLFGTPIGGVGFLLNLPLFIWALLSVGYKLLFKTFVATLFTSAAIDLLGLVAVPYRGDTLLAALFGGVLGGVGLGLVFLRAAPPAAPTWPPRLLEHHLPHLSMTKLMLCLDAAVVAASALVYRSLESPLYALVVIFATTRVIDAMLYGADVGTGKVFYIISAQSQQIAQQIIRELDRGVTFLEGRGGFTGQPTQVLLCAVRRFEVSRVKQIVRRCDPKAFLDRGDAGRSPGRGSARRARRTPPCKPCCAAGKRDKPCFSRPGMV